ncbi:MAG: hypothetical protein ACREJ3_14395, partial [Polyangiaceae bacterium]
MDPNAGWVAVIAPRSVLAALVAIAPALAALGCSSPGSPAASDAGSAPACTAGNCPVVLASGQNNPERIAIDSTSVYWVNFDPDCHAGAIMKVALDGGNPTAIVSGRHCPE